MSDGIQWLVIGMMIGAEIMYQATRLLLKLKETDG
jgi:hypothetical protein